MRYIKTLLKLKELGELNYSQLPQTLIKELRDENLIEIKTLSANKKKIIVKEAFYIKYKNLKEIQNSSTRAQLSKITHTKKIKISPQDGLYINGKCDIEGVKLPLFSNSALFLKEAPKISKNILIIGVENFENLLYFESQLKYFQKSNILFVYRNSAMLKFFQTLENKIIYFGDFDLAGINIYQTEILPRCKSVTFFIPHNIEELIMNDGSVKLYKKQYNKYKNIKSENRNIQNLIDIINKNQKALEQEYFI